MRQSIGLVLLTAVLCACSALPVTGVRPGVYAALGDDPEEAIEHANKFCRREEHKTIAIAVNDVGSVVDQSNKNEGSGGVEVRKTSDTFTMNAGQTSGHTSVFQFSCG